MRVMFKKTSMASSLNKSTILDNINLYNHSGSTDYHEQPFDLCFWLKCPGLRFSVWKLPDFLGGYWVSSYQLLQEPLGRSGRGEGGKNAQPYSFLYFI